MDEDDKVYDLQTETLSGDVRDALLTHVRDMNVGWKFLSEKEQRDKIYAMTRCAETLVRQTINLVSNFEFPNLSVEVGVVKIDKALEIKLGALTTIQNITHLAEHGKSRAVLVLCDPEVFFGEQAPAEPDADEPALPLDDAA